MSPHPHSLMPSLAPSLPPSLPPHSLSLTLNVSLTLCVSLSISLPPTHLHIIIKLEHIFDRPAHVDHLTHSGWGHKVAINRVPAHHQQTLLVDTDANPTSTNLPSFVNTMCIHGESAQAPHFHLSLSHPSLLPAPCSHATLLSLLPPLQLQPPHTPLT